MYDILIQRNLRWSKNVQRMGNTRLPKQNLYYKVCEGSRGIGRQKRRFKDTVKRNLKAKKMQMYSKQRESWNTMTRRIQ